MKFSEEKCRVLHLGRYNPRDQDMLGDAKLEISSAEKNMGVLVNTILNMSQQYVLMLRQNHRIARVGRDLKRSLCLTPC